MSAAANLDFLWASAAAAPQQPKTIAQPTTSFAFYRKHTEALLRRYMHLSMEMGRTPSLLGNCIFRGRVSSYRMRTFEDSVIFVFDVEKCLKRLSTSAQDLVARIALQEYTHGETAALTGQSIRSVVRKYGEALDRLTEIFVEVELLRVGPLP